MKNIYQKIGIILVASFIVQVVSVGIFYKQVVLNKIINEINLQEDNRQVILQEAVDIIQKYDNNPEKLQGELDGISHKFHVDFTVKNGDEDTVYYTAALSSLDTDRVREQAYLKLNNQKSYIIYGVFPSNITNLTPNKTQRRVRAIVYAIVFFIWLIMTFIIYRLLINPLKKLNKAVETVDYGNTVVQIPYYTDDEIGRLCRSLEDMGGRLKSSENTQKELIQAVAHDIKTPLTSIIGYSKRLMEGKVKEDRKEEYYGIIYRKSNDLKNLLMELDDYSSINIDKRYEKLNTNAYDYFEEIFKEAQKDVEEEEGKLNYDNNISRDTIILIDEKKIKRVVFNIIHNSIKYAGDNPQINIICIEDSESIKISIIDDGDGVPEDQIERIFDRFYRVETSRSREKGGTGLGLSICKDIIEAHGGSIKAENKDNAGLCIEFTLRKNLHA